MELCFSYLPFKVLFLSFFVFIRLKYIQKAACFNQIYAISGLFLLGLSFAASYGLVMRYVTEA